MVLLGSTALYQADVSWHTSSDSVVDSFEAWVSQAGKWYCSLRNPLISLDNSNGAVDRLAFWYDQVYTPPRPLPPHVSLILQSRRQNSTRLADCLRQ